MYISRDSVTRLGHAKELDGRSTSMYRAFFGINLLEAEVVSFLVEIVQARAIPLLILFRVILLETTYVLGKLL